jgi:adenosylcobinamide kinase/adenosylcobinamide-phosphate guanylyltransferase
LIDSLGTWLANLLDQDDATWHATVATLVDSLRHTPATVILVSEETGWGVVPAYPIGRLFRDRLGSLTRQVGAVAGAVYLVVAGYAVDVKRLGEGVGDGVMG